MDSFYSEAELKQIGFKMIGENVLISRKASIYGQENITLGNNVRIDDFCILSGYIEIGSNVHIAAYSALYGGNDGIFIKDFVNLSSRISVYSRTDDYSGESMTNPMIPDEFKNIRSASVVIKKHVIVGSTSVIMPGVTLNEGSSFGAFSFINCNSEAWSINIGIPFKKIKERKKNILKLEHDFMKKIGD